MTPFSGKIKSCINAYKGIKTILIITIIINGIHLTIPAMDMETIGVLDATEVI